MNLQQIFIALNDPRPAAVAPRNPGADRIDEFSVGRTLSGPKTAGNPEEDRRANRALFAAKLLEHVSTLRKNAREWLEKNPTFLPTNVTVIDNRFTALGGYSLNTTGPQPITLGADLDAATRIHEVMAVVDRELASFYKQATRLGNFRDLIASQNPGKGPHKDTDHTIRVEFGGLKDGLEESVYILSTPPSQHELNADKRNVFGSLDLDTGYFDPMRGRFKAVVVYPDPDGRFKDVVDGHAAGMTESRTARDQEQKYGDEIMPLIMNADRAAHTFPDIRKATFVVSYDTSSANPHAPSPSPSPSPNADHLMIKTMAPLTAIDQTSLQPQHLRFEIQEGASLMRSSLREENVFERKLPVRIGLVVEYSPDAGKTTRHALIVPGNTTKQDQAMAKKAQLNSKIIQILGTGNLRSLAQVNESRRVAVDGTAPTRKI